MKKFKFVFIFFLLCANLKIESFADVYGHVDPVPISPMPPMPPPIQPPIANPGLGSPALSAPPAVQSLPAGSVSGQPSSAAKTKIKHKKKVTRKSDATAQKTPLK